MAAGIIIIVLSIAVAGLIWFARRQYEAYKELEVKHIETVNEHDIMEARANAWECRVNELKEENTAYTATIMELNDRISELNIRISELKDNNPEHPAGDEVGEPQEAVLAHE